MSAELASLAQRVVAANIAAGRVAALAESCTGGMVAAAITDVPGSSAMFAASLVTYANSAKQGLLGVDPAILDRYGAVSRECAAAMAAGALDRTGADVAVSITGVAGPDGGTAAKPVGTVHFARAVRTAEGIDNQVRQEQFPPDAGRAAIREMAAVVALTLLLPGASIDQAAP